MTFKIKNIDKEGHVTDSMWKIKTVNCALNYLDNLITRMTALYDLLH